MGSREVSKCKCGSAQGLGALTALSRCYRHLFCKTTELSPLLRARILSVFKDQMETAPWLVTEKKCPSINGIDGRILKTLQIGGLDQTAPLDTQYPWIPSQKAFLHKDQLLLTSSASTCPVCRQGSLKPPNTALGRCWENNLGNDPGKMTQPVDKTGHLKAHEPPSAGFLGTTHIPFFTKAVCTPMASGG